MPTSEIHPLGGRMSRNTRTSTIVSPSPSSRVCSNFPTIAEQSTEEWDSGIKLRGLAKLFASSHSPRHRSWRVRLSSLEKPLCTGCKFSLGSRLATTHTSKMRQKYYFSPLLTWKSSRWAKTSTEKNWSTCEKSQCRAGRTKASSYGWMTIPKKAAVSIRLFWISTLESAPILFSCSRTST